MAIKRVPVAALRMGVSLVEFRSNGPNAKTVPVRLVARSADPIDHWYWGKIVHDLGGVNHKPNIPIDYAHNDADVLGFLNHFEITDRGLEASGALVPYAKRADDKASEVIHKQQAGVPYEASINWAGPAKLQTLAENELATVNGREFVGPMTVVRDWDLRGVAVCPYGADHNTATEFAAGDTAAVEYIELPAEARRFAAPEAAPPPAAPEAADDDQAKPEADQAPPAPAAPEAPEAPDDDQVKPEADQAPPADPPAAAAPEAPDDDQAAPEADQAPTDDPPAAAAPEAAGDDQADDEDDDPAPAVPVVAEAATASAAPVEADRAAAGRRFVEAFGSILGPRYFAEGLTLAAAKDRAIADLAEENRRLSARLSSLVGGNDTAPLFTTTDPARGGDAPAGRDELAERLGPGVARFARATRARHSL